MKTMLKERANKGRFLIAFCKIKKYAVYLKISWKTKKF